MIISFTNVIGAIRNAISSVITTNLKMWLGFETSETLGREEVVNGDFATDLSNWDISGTDATHTVTYSNQSARFESDNVTPQLNFDQTISNVEVGKTYQLSIDVTYTTGTLKVVTISGVALYLEDGLNVFSVVAANNTIRITRNANIVDALINSVSLKELTQITPDKSGNNNVGELFTGKALDFDGAGDYIDISGFSMSGNNATFAFWAYIEENTKGDYFFDFRSASTRFILGFGQTSQKLAIYSNSGSGSWNDFGDPPQDQWVRIVLTVKGTTAKCFVDGVQLGTDKTISTYDFSSATIAHIGARYEPEASAKWYDGLLSDFQVYNKAWLNEDIAYDYANPQNLVTDSDNTTIALSNLKAYWAMSEGAGSLTYDSSGEGNNGTINGATYEPAQPRIPQLGMMDWSKGSNLFPYSEDFTQWNVSSGGTITPNFALAPNGTQTATKYNIDGNFRVFLYTLNLSTSKEYTFSFYAKNISSTVAAYRVYDATNEENVIVTSYLSELSTTDWTRIDVTFNTTSTGTSYNLYLMSGQGTGDILFWGSQLEESSSASAYRLTDGAATLNSTVIANPTIPTKDIFGNLVRDRLNSFNLDGSGYAEVADDADLDIGTGAFTMECWVKADFENTGSVVNVIYSLGGDYNDTDTATIATNSTIIRAKVGGLNLTADSGNNYTIGDWYHVCVTRDGSNLCTLYIDAEAQLDTETTSASITNTSTKLIGRDSLTTRFYQNLISDVRLYKGKALTSDEVENNYNAGLSAHTNN